MEPDWEKLLGLDDPATIAASRMIGSKWELIERMRVIREERGLSQETVAERMGVKVSKVRLLEFQGIGTIYGLISYALAVGVVISFELEEGETGNG